MFKGDRNLAWIDGKRLSLQWSFGRYWVRLGNVDSNKTRNPRHALRWGCRIKKRLLEFEPGTEVLSLAFRSDDRWYSMAYRNPFN